MTSVAGDIRPSVALPSVSVRELKFSDGTAIALKPDDTVVLVGPNNSGKSAALRQIRENIAQPGEYTVVHKCTLDIAGSKDDLVAHIKSHSQKIFTPERIEFVGYNFEIRQFELDYLMDCPRGALKSFFSLYCRTDERLSGSDPVKSISYRKARPSHPMHVLVMDKKIEALASSAFHSAFGKYLHVNRAGGNEVELYISDIEFDAKPQDDFSNEAAAFFTNDSQPLNLQGDGMRAFATLTLNTLALSQQTMLLIDEPEAFLHPPQARLLGSLIARPDSHSRQVYIATHSADVLKGVISSAKRQPLILRISRSGDVNNVRVLDSNAITKLNRDPLIRFSGILDAIFHSHVIICEADTDCQFYSAVLEAIQDDADVRPDALFVQSAGKHRMAKLGEVARQLGVPFSTIVDIDALNEKALFKDLCKVSGIDWSEVEADWRAVFDAVSGLKPSLTLSQVVAAIEAAMIQLKNGDIALTDFLAKVRDSVRSNSPWENVKLAGRNALPLGAVVQHFDKLLATCARSGLWIVPEGELESFCRTVRARKGSSWIIELSERFDIRQDAALNAARDFVRNVWLRALRGDTAIEATEA